MNDSFRAAVERSAEIDARIATHPEEFRMMTGDRPTGTLHIGHYFGSIANRLRLQEYGAETWVLVADYQVITDREVGRRQQRDVRRDPLCLDVAERDPVALQLRTTGVRHRDRHAYEGH